MAMKCSRCGGNGHNRRTCKNEPKAGAAAAPATSKRLARKVEGGGKKRRARAKSTARSREVPSPSAALTLASGRGQLAARELVHGPELEKVREKVATDLRELGRALLTFEVIEILRRV